MNKKSNDYLNNIKQNIVDFSKMIIEEKTNIYAGTYTGDKWEYKVKSGFFFDERELNRFGADGWELVL